MPQTPAPTRANVRQSATWRISDTNLSPPCQLTTHAADSMLFLSKSRLFGFLPTKFPEYPNRERHLMAQNKLTMRQIQEILRLKHQNQLSIREIARSCGLP